MNMKNADKPANPTPYMKQDEAGGELYCDEVGLTKRETFAMNADVTAHIEDVDIYTVLDFLGFEQYPEKLTTIEIIKYRLQAEAKLSVMSADLRLAELEK